MKAPQAGIRPYLWMLLAALALATMAALSKAAGETVHWSLVATARAGVMLILALGLLGAGRIRFVLWKPPSLWVRSISGSLGLLCTFYAVTHIPVADAITLMNMYPLWIAVLSWPLLGERPGRAVWGAILVSGLGVFLITRPSFQQGNPIGTLAGIGNSFFTAVAMLGLHKAGGLDARVVVAHFSLIGTLIAGGVLFGLGQAGPSVSSLGARETLYLVGVGVTGTLGQLAMTRAYATGTPSRVALVALTQLLFAIGFDIAFWHRRFDAYALAGIALVAAPTGWLIYSRRRAAVGTTEAIAAADGSADKVPAGTPPS